MSVSWRFAVKSLTNDPARWVQEIRQLPPCFQGFTLDCPYPLPQVPASTLSELAALREARDLTYFVHTPVGRIRLGDPEPSVRQTSLEEVKRAIWLAKQVGGRLITVHPTPQLPPHGRQQAEMQQLERAALAELCAYSAGHEVAVALENMQPHGPFPSGYSDFSDLFALVKQIGQLGVTLDVGHAHLASLSPSMLVQRLGRRLWHLHIHDNDGSADLHLPVGWGTVDWAGLVSALWEIGYHGFLELEFQGRAAQLASRRYLETMKLKCNPTPKHYGI